MSQPISLAEYSKITIQGIKNTFRPQDLQESETTLADRQAIQVIFSYQDRGKEFKRMQTWKLKNNRAYLVTYTAMMRPSSSCSISIV